MRRPIITNIAINIDDKLHIFDKENIGITEVCLFNVLNVQQNIKLDSNCLEHIDYNEIYYKIEIDYNYTGDCIVTKDLWDTFSIASFLDYQYTLHHNQSIQTFNLNHNETYIL